MKVEKQIGKGNEYIYLYYNPNEKTDTSWPCKIGKSKNDPKFRINEQKIKTAFSYDPVIGLIIKTDHSSLLERYIHNKLSACKIKNEWYNTNPASVETIFLERGEDFKDISSPLHIGLKIREARENKDWSQQKLANMCNIRQETISIVESGKTNFSIDTLLSILKALELKIDIIPHKH